MVAGPVVTWLRWATGRAVPETKSPSATVPKMPPVVLADTVPTSCWAVKSPFSWPGSPFSPFFTAFTEVSIMEPLARGISWTVSVSVMPWPRAP